MISIKGLTKSFKDRVAVDALSLEVPKGAIFGLLGHNGAGKSTTLGCLLGHLFPDKGESKVAGFDVLKNRPEALAKVGAIFETPAFYDYLSGYRNLHVFSDLTRRVEDDRLYSVVELVGLETRIHDNVSSYSHGMRQRLALAQALLPEPDLLILDEPTDGLDPEGIIEMRKLIKKLNKEHGLTILLSSHMLNEVELLCDHIAVMQEGKLLFSGKISELPKPEKWIYLKAKKWNEAVNWLTEQQLIESMTRLERVQLKSEVTIEEVISAVAHREFGLQAIYPVELTLEEFYMNTVNMSKVDV